MERDTFAGRTFSGGRSGSASKLQYLAGEIETRDFAPTESQKQVAELLRTQLRAVKRSSIG